MMAPAGTPKEIIDRMAAEFARALKDPQMIDQIQWGSMDVNGRVYEESLSDIQDFYVRNKLIARKYTREELGPPDWAAALAAKLGPFTLAHDDGLPGCR